MRYNYYPVEYLIKIFKLDYFDQNWYGFIKCKIIRPKNLYHPVLPINTCDKNKIQKCEHTDVERSFIGI